MSVVVCSENRRADWDDLIAHCADATSGHLWEWREVVGSAYGLEAFYLMAQDGHGRPIAAAPFVFVRSFLYGSGLSSMPYMTHGGVCHADGLDAAGRETAQAELIDHSRDLATKLRAKRLAYPSLQRMRPPFEVSTGKKWHSIWRSRRRSRSTAEAAVGAAPYGWSESRSRGWRSM